jgi:ketopantoate reductase
MKKVILGVAIAATVGLVGCTPDSEWQKLHTDTNFTTYIKTDSVRVEIPEENIRSIWQKGVFNNGTNTVYKVVVNCNNHEYLNKSASTFDTATGKEIDFQEHVTDWQQAIPSTNIMLTVNKVCK